MALVTTKEMFKKAYEGGYAIGAFNINNMEIIQAITEAAAEAKSPVILQVSAGARKYAKHEYLLALAQAAIKDSGVDLALHLDHGAYGPFCAAVIIGGCGDDFYLYFVSPFAGALHYLYLACLLIYAELFAAGYFFVCNSTLCPADLYGLYRLCGFSEPGCSDCS
jgi:hypothetical protein